MASNASSLYYGSLGAEAPSWQTNPEVPIWDVSGGMQNTLSGGVRLPTAPVAQQPVVQQPVARIQPVQNITGTGNGGSGSSSSRGAVGVTVGSGWNAASQAGVSDAQAPQTSTPVGTRRAIDNRGLIDPGILNDINAIGVLAGAGTLIGPTGFLAASLLNAGFKAYNNWDTITENFQNAFQKVSSIFGGGSPSMTGVADSQYGLTSRNYTGVQNTTNVAGQGITVSPGATSGTGYGLTSGTGSSSSGGINPSSSSGNGLSVGSSGSRGYGFGSSSSGSSSGGYGLSSGSSSGGGLSVGGFSGSTSGGYGLSGGSGGFGSSSGGFGSSGGTSGGEGE